MKPRKPPRHCIVCGEAYHKTGSAKCCSPACSAEWQKSKHAKWRRENPEKWAQWSARFHANNPGYQAAYMRARRALERA